MSTRWRSSGTPILWTTIRNILQDGILRRRPEGFLDSTKDFMLDCLDDALEPIARGVGGRRIWAEMQQNAEAASGRGGGMLVVLRELKKLLKRHPKLQVHLVGHSAGSILLGALAGANQEGRNPIVFESCTMWAPACTVDFYREHYVPALKGRSLKRFTLFTLTDGAERDDNCANIYHKSLLYLVSNAFENDSRVASFGRSRGVPLLGMQTFAAELTAAERPTEWVLSPNAVAEGQPGASRSTTHGGFDDDAATLKATLARILGTRVAGITFSHHRSEAAQRDQRAAIMQQTGSA
ncbi:MAG: hypothetical protein QM736_05330 [Vicinamibacterales bacterium]